MGNKVNSHLLHIPVTICPNCLSLIPKLFIYVIQSKVYVDLICDCCPQQIQSMSLSSYLLFIKQNAIKAPMNNFNCKTHNEKYIEFCNECFCNICKKCMKEHSNHNTIVFKELNKEIDVEALKEKCREINIRIIQSNQIIKIDFDDTIKTKYPELNERLNDIEKCFYTNFSVNSEFADIANLIINTYEIAEKYGLMNGNVLFNLKQGTKFNSRMLDATEEDYGERIQTLLKYFNSNFLLIQFSSSINYKANHLYKNNTNNILGICLMNDNAIGILLDNNVTIVVNYKGETIKEYTEHKSKEKISNGLILFTSNHLYYGSYNSNLFVYSNESCVKQIEYKDINLYNIIEKDDWSSLQNDSYHINGETIFAKLSESKYLICTNKKHISYYSTNSPNPLHSETFSFTVSDIVTVENSNIILSTSMHTFLLINTDSYKQICSVFSPTCNILKTLALTDHIFLASTESNFHFYDMRTKQQIYSMNNGNISCFYMKETSNRKLIVSSLNEVELLDNSINFN